MKQSNRVRGGSVLGSVCLGVFALGSACHVVVEKSDQTGGQPGVDAQSSGGSATVSGGSDSTSSGTPTASGGSGTEGGASTAAGGTSAASGGTSTSAGAQSVAGAGAAGSQHGAPLVEACGSPEPKNNDDRNSAIDLGSGATICLEDGSDHDWFYLDTPDDGKAHLIQLDFAQEPTAWFDLTLYAAADFSNIGSARLEKGVKGTIYVTVGPGARTLFDFQPFIASAALITVKVSVTAEDDGYEPNNTREAAAAIMPGMEISAQLWVPYVSSEQQSMHDWYKLDLSPGKHVFQLTSVSEDVYMDVDISSSARVAVSSGRAPNRGATFQFSFDVGTAGSYVFDLADFISRPVVMVGSKPRFLAEPYKFRID